jgi:hypothetical protein
MPLMMINITITMMMLMVVNGISERSMFASAMPHRRVSWVAAIRLEQDDESTVADRRRFSADHKAHDAGRCQRTQE